LKLSLLLRTTARARAAASAMRTDSGGSRNQNLWGQPVGAMGPNHICYSKIALDSSKPVGPDGPTGYTYVRH
jgi:hypothetical protein